MIQLTVLLLQVDFPRNGLEVSNSRFGFDADDEAQAGDRGSPRAKVAGGWQGYFGSPAQIAVDPSPQPAQKHHVRGVTDRISGGVQAERRLETERRSDPADRRQRDLGSTTALDAPDHRAGDAGRCSNVSQGESRSHPCKMDLATRDLELFGDPVLRTLLRTFARSHRAERATRAFTRPYLQRRLARVTPCVTPGERAVAAGRLAGHLSRGANTSVNDLDFVGRSSRGASRSTIRGAPIRWLSHRASNSPPRPVSRG